MSHIEISDFNLWTKHIQNNDSLKEKIMGLNEGDTIELDVGGLYGTWEKMQDGADGRRTHGIKYMPKGLVPIREDFRV